MKEYSNLESYAEHVKDETCSLLAMLCRDLGPEHRATIKALELLTEAGGIVHQRQMQQEQAGGYNLASLKVNAETASNSETGWEREE